jgi:hypothetical protein
MPDARLRQRRFGMLADCVGCTRGRGWRACTGLEHRPGGDQARERAEVFGVLDGESGVADGGGDVAVGVAAAHP